MRSFLKEYLEPLVYLMYAIILYFVYKGNGLVRHRILFYYYLFAAALLFECIVFSQYDNLWNYNLLFLLTIVVFSWYFQSLFITRNKKNAVLICFVINVALFCYVDIISAQFISKFSSYVYAIVFITIVVYTLLYFHQLLVNVKEENILLDFDFWLVSGYLLYFLGAFFIILYYDTMHVSKRGDMWVVQTVILLLSSLITLNGHLRIIKDKNKI